LADQALGTMRSENKQCPRFSLPLGTTGVRTHTVVVEDPAPRPGDLSYTLTSTAQGPASMITGSTTILTVRSGPTLVGVSASSSWAGPALPATHVSSLRALCRLVADTALMTMNNAV
jgi:hypothetical protein